MASGAALLTAAGVAATPFQLRRHVDQCRTAAVEVPRHDDTKEGTMGGYTNERCSGLLAQCERFSWQKVGALWCAVLALAGHAVVAGGEQHLLTAYRMGASSGQILPDGRYADVWSLWEAVDLDRILLDASNQAVGWPPYTGSATLAVKAAYSDEGLYLAFEFLDTVTSRSGPCMIDVYLDKYGTDTIKSMTIEALSASGLGVYTGYYLEYQMLFCTDACPTGYSRDTDVGTTERLSLDSAPDGLFFDTIPPVGGRLRQEWYIPWSQYALGGVAMPTAGERLALLVGYVSYPEAIGLYWLNHESNMGVCTCEQIFEPPLWLWSYCCDLDGWCTYGDLEFGPDLPTGVAPGGRQGLAPSHGASVDRAEWFDLRGNRLSGTMRWASSGPVVRRDGIDGRAAVEVLVGERRRW